MSASALEQSFFDIIAKHRLTRLDVGVREDGDRGATCWWDGFSRSGCACQHGHGKTIAEAISNCLALAAADRASLSAGTLLADEPLTIGDAA